VVVGPLQRAVVLLIVPFIVGFWCGVEHRAEDTGATMIYNVGYCYDFQEVSNMLNLHCLLLRYLSVQYVFHNKAIIVAP